MGGQKRCRGVIDDAGTRCGKQPKYGCPGEPPLFCSKHKSAEMIDVVAKTCDACGKGKKVYGLKTTRVATMCSACANGRDDMIILDKKGCQKKLEPDPSNPVVFTNKNGETFCPENGRKRGADGLMYCPKHCGENSQDLSRAYCRIDGCGGDRSYGLEGDSSPSWCSTHAKEASANDPAGRDVVNLKKKRCHCGKIASFGPLVEGQDRKVSSVGAVCLDHRIEGTHYFHGHPFCAHDGCMKQNPRHDTSIGKCCGEHASEVA